MRKIIITILISFVLVTLSSCEFLLFTCNHKYVKHYGLMPHLSKEGLVNWYTCEKCSKYFDEDFNEFEPISMNLSAYKNEKGSILYAGEGFDIYYSDELKDYITEYEEKLDKNIEEAKAPKETVIKNLNTLFGLRSLVYDDVNNYYIAFSLFNNNDYYVMYNEVSDYFNDTYLYISDMFTRLGNSKYRYEVFYNLTQEEADKIYSSYNPKADTERSAIEKRISEIELKYQLDELTLEEAFNGLKDEGMNLAKMYDYKNYMEYAYQRKYGRDYMPEDTYKIGGYIKDYIYDVYHAFSSKISSSVSNMTDEDKDTYLRLRNNSFATSYTLLADYANQMDSLYKKNYVSAIRNGAIYSSNIQNDTVTSYVGTYYDDSPYMFLGNGTYQNVGSFIHEFGHYNNDIINPNGVDSLDLKEIHSQGNESLFYTYAVKNNNSLGYELYALDEMQSNVRAIVYTYFCDYVEYNAYNYDGFVTEEMMQGYWDEIANETGFTEFVGNSYWKYPVLNNRCYYISYAVSAAESLYLYSLAQSDYDAAKAKYIKLYDYKDCNTFSDVLKYAGMPLAFDEELYKTIHDNLA